MSIYIDTETGTWGDADCLSIVDEQPSVETDAMLTSMSDSAIIKHGKLYGNTLEYEVNDAVAEYARSIVEFDGEVKDAVSRLYYAAEAILEALGVDPSEPCKLCDTTFGFHTSECPTHEMNIATDAVAEWVR